LRTRTVFAGLNQVDGFDCPSCAWPEAEHRSPFEFCENGERGIRLGGDDQNRRRRFLRRALRRGPVGAIGSLAGGAGPGDPPHASRAPAPRTTRRSPGTTHSASSAALRGLPDPNRALFYTSGRTSNEAAFLYQLFARRLGTHNLPDCSNMCHESSGSALTRTIGIGKGTVSLEDVTDYADLIVVVGRQNPGPTTRGCSPRWRPRSAAARASSR
jgi:hypothetical protein